jgi:hypothetical protein
MTKRRGKTKKTTPASPAQRRQRKKMSTCAKQCVRERQVGPDYQPCVTECLREEPKGRPKPPRGSWYSRGGPREAWGGFRDAARPKSAHVASANALIKDARLNIKRCSATSALPYAGCKKAREALKQAIQEVDQIEQHAIAWEEYRRSR